MKRKTPAFINPTGAALPPGIGGALLNAARRYGAERAVEGFRHAQAQQRTAAFGRRDAAPLPKDTEEMVDDMVVRVGRDRLTLVADMLDEGLIKSIPNWLAVPTLYWEKIGEAGRAQQTMVPSARGERQVLDRTGSTLPLYATWDDFSFDIREILAAERVGMPLDDDGIEQAVRNVNEAIEDAAINDGPSIDGNTVPGVLSAPNVNTFTYETNTAWDDAGKTGAEIIQDVQSGVTALHADGRYGPYNLYVPTEYGIKLEENYSDGTTTFDITIRQRLERLNYGGRGLRVRVADQLPDDRTVLMQMTRDVADVIVGQQPVPLSWEDGPGFETYWMILSCMVTRFKDDANGGSGIAVGNTT